MESLMDEIDSLVAPDLSTTARDWCDNCQSLRKDLKKLQEEQEQSFVKLKQKIISTDLLIKKYKSKCEDYDVQYKKNEEATKRADKYQRQSEILETQLKATLMETEPLRGAKISLESEVKQKNKEIEDLRHKLVVTEGVQRQYENLNKSSNVDIEKLESEKRALNVRIKVLESGKVTKEAAKELKVEIQSLKKENTGLKKREKQLERKLESALSKIEHLTERLKENRIAPVDRRRRTTSGSLLSPVRSPNRSPRTRKPSPGSSGTSPKKVGQKSSPKLRVPAQRVKAEESEESSEDSSDEDAMSVFSVKWTFSPVMQCLSPLPPSPCHIESQKSLTEFSLSDDGNISDMADELEQQLLGNNLPSEDTQINDDSIKTTKEVTLLKPKHEIIDEQATGKDSSQDVNIHVKCKNQSNRDESVSELSKESDGNKSVEDEYVSETNNKPGEINNKHGENKSAADIVAECTESSGTKDINDSLPESSLKNESLNVIPNVKTEKVADHQTVKERLTASIEIVSPRATRKRTAHVPGGNSNSNTSGEGRKDSTDLKSSVHAHKQTDKLSDKSCTVKEIIKSNTVRQIVKSKETENNEITEQLRRNDTSEFDPIVGENAEIDSKTVEKDNDIIDTPYITKTDLDDNCDRDERRHKDGLDVKEMVKAETTETTVMPTGHEKQSDIHEEIIQTKSIDTSDASRRDKEKLVHNVHDIQGEIEIDIREESEAVSYPCKTPPPLRGYLIRQNCVQKQGDSSQDNVKTEVREQTKSKSKLSFMKFQKASYGTLEDEINNLQDCNDYTVLSRDAPQRPGTVTGGEKRRSLRSIKRSLKSNSKFVDLDSAGASNQTQEQSNIALAFTKQSSKDKKNIQRGLNTNDNKEGKAVKDGCVSNSENHQPSVSESHLGIECKDKELPTTQGNKQIDSSVKSAKQLCNVKESSSNKRKDICDVNAVELSCKRLHDGTRKDSDSSKYPKLGGETCSNEGLKVDKTEYESNNIKNIDAISSAINKEDEMETIACVNDDDGTPITGVSTDQTGTVSVDMEHNDIKSAAFITSRQMSTGFIVNQRSVERTPSVEHSVSNETSVNKVCDKERNKLRTRETPPISKHTNTSTHSCETISEESECSVGFKDKVTGDSVKCDVILGIDDLFNDVQDSGKKENNQFEPRQVDCQQIRDVKSEQSHREIDAGESAISDKSHTEILSANSSIKKDSKLIEKSDFNLSEVSKTDKASFKSSNDIINEPGCSYHYVDPHCPSLPLHDSEFVTVTSTSSLTTSSRLLTCTPDNLDTDNFIMCQSQSRSTTPSICSIEMSTPPLSPLSVSPFDFIIPVSPLPPSPVRQVEDRVSPLSPEHLTEHVNEHLTEHVTEHVNEHLTEYVTEQLEDITEESASNDNENERNAGNIPVLMTPEKPIPEKFIEYSPVPDLISPIKTPKQSGIQHRHKKSKKGKGKLHGVKLDVNSPVKFVSNVPSGVLTVKPKPESVSMNANCKGNRLSMKHLDLRKHVTVKECVDIWSNKDSVFKRKVGKISDANEIFSDCAENSLDTRLLKQSDATKTGQTVMKNPDTNTDEVIKDSETCANSHTQTSAAKVPQDKSMDTKGDSKDLTTKEVGKEKNEHVTINASGDCKDVTMKEIVDEKNNENVIIKGEGLGKDTNMKEVDKEKNKAVTINKAGDSIDTKMREVDKVKITNVATINTEGSGKDTRMKEVDKVKNTNVTINAKGHGNNRKINVVDEGKNKHVTINSAGDGVEQNSENVTTRSSQDLDTTLRSKVTESETSEKGDNKVECNTTKHEVEIVPAGYSDPLLTSKRKTRMAHQPRSQPLIVKKPPVIIEPTFLVQGTRRKRKSQDSNDKDAVPRKQAKGVVFQKMRTDVDSTSQENCRKMEAFLKSAEKAEQFVNSMKDIPAEKSTGLYIAEMCLECIGRVKTDMLDTIYHSCNSGAYLTLKGDSPFLNNVEKKAVQLLVTVSKNKHLAIDTEGILKLVWKSIFTKELTVTMVGKMSLVKIFTALCLDEGDVEQVRVLLYHISTCGYLNHWLFVVPIVSVWPEVLRKDISAAQSADSTQTLTHDMLLVFEYVVTKNLLGQDTASSRKVLTIMAKLCNWSGVLENPETLLKQQVTHLFDVCSEQLEGMGCTFALVKACKLLLMHENWAWFKEYFVNRQGLQPAVNRYLCKKGTIATNYVCVVLEITGSMVTYWSESAKQRDLQQICKTWLMAILSNQQGDPIVQRYCLDTILEISVFNPSVISDLRIWFKKKPDNAVNGYLERLEALRQAFGINCEPFVKK